MPSWKGKAFPATIKGMLLLLARTFTKQLYIYINILYIYCWPRET